jgi:hypothetical protein
VPSVQSGKKTPAIHFKMVGGPMAISQEFWLWEGAPDWKTIQAGPAEFRLGEPGSSIQNTGARKPTLSFQVEKDGSVTYHARSSDGKQVRGKFSQDQIRNQVIHPGWKGNVTITVLDWIPDAAPSTTFKPARIQYGNQAPSSAIHVVASDQLDVWLGLGDRATLHLAGREVEVGYFPKRVVLPFSLRLERFTIEHDQGTMSPASYASRVTSIHANGQKDALISMNEPLDMGEFTVYQASYEDAEPRPITSIFSVNRDPGRSWKYIGSLLIVLGSVLLFAAKYQRGKSTKKVQDISSLGSVSEASV